MRHRTLRLFLVIAAPFLLLLIAELLALAYLAVAPQTVTAKSDIALLAYAHSDYYGPVFAAEAKSASGVTDYHGKWINVTNDRRATTGQPVHARHTLWLFGNSTMLSIGTPDSMTIASYLQQRIGQRYIVQNMGINAANVFTELETLQNSPIRRGDIVIFYDGSVDAAAPYVTAQADYQKSAPCWRLTAWDWTALYKVLCAGNLNDVPGFDAGAIDVTSTVAKYERGLNMARTWATAHGAAYYHFLQPNIWSRPLSAYETTIVNRWSYAGVAQSVAVLYPAMQAATPTGENLTHILDTIRASGTVVYLDGFHTTERGNEAVADAMVDAIWRAF